MVTIHDLNYRLVPEAHLGLLRFGMRALVPLAARRSSRILVDAASTRGDLERPLRVPPEKIDVVPLGLGAQRRAAPVPEGELRRRIDAGDRPIVLCAAAKRPHKNLARLIGAIALIPVDRRPLLVLPGYPTAHEAELRERTRSSGLPAMFASSVGSTRPSSRASTPPPGCFVLPSLQEGFGLPVLEAMARGVPVACSCRGALAEVAGDAALRFDPESEPEIASAISKLVGDDAEVAAAAGRGAGAGGAVHLEGDRRGDAGLLRASARRALAPHRDGMSRKRTAFRSGQDQD